MMSESVIRIIQPPDLDQIIDLEIKCFGDKNAYSKGQLKYLTLNAHSYCLVEENDDRIRGFIIVLFRKKSHIAGIETLNVDPAYRGIGIGKRLLIAAEKEMKARMVNKVRLEVSAGNTFAIGLYEKVGFKKTEILKKYYQNISFETYDAYRMVKELT